MRLDFVQHDTVVGTGHLLVAAMQVMFDLHHHSCHSHKVGCWAVVGVLCLIFVASGSARMSSVEKIGRNKASDLTNTHNADRNGCQYYYEINVNNMYITQQLLVHND